MKTEGQERSKKVLEGREELSEISEEARHALLRSAEWPYHAPLLRYLAERLRPLEFRWTERREKRHGKSRRWVEFHEYPTSNGRRPTLVELLEIVETIRQWDAEVLSSSLEGIPHPRATESRVMEKWSGALWLKFLLLDRLKEVKRQEERKARR